MRRFIIITALALIAFIAGGLGGAALYIKDLYERPGNFGEAKIVDIPWGSGVNGVWQALGDAGIIDINDPVLPYSFRLGLRQDGLGQRLKAGEYEIPARASLQRIAKILADGKVIQRSITIPEGLSRHEIVALINAAPALQGEITRLPREGHILPETWAYAKNEDRQVLLDRMEAAMTEYVEAAWQNRDRNIPINSIEEVLILASIVEKETGVSAERAKVASVFMNRLKKGMPLQTDPTVIFAFTLGKVPFGRALTRRDLKVDSRYNTYLHRGLPPGAIANPGKAAIDAVLNPDDTPYFYFVADGSGGHAFAKTLTGHNKNVAKWRKIQKSRQ